MNLDENKLNQIIQVLNLEKIKVVQKIELWLYPNQTDKEFNEKVESLKKELGQKIILKIIEEGRIEDAKSIVSNES